ncbi:MAG: LL-diaminopimelate aminotransferase, partial [Parachlamydiaceae bacterium]
MTKRNTLFEALNTNYLFPEINLRKKDFLSRHPEASLISLGIGDTTEPLSPYITQALVKASARLGTQEGYSGYGPEQGMKLLRERIVNAFYPHPQAIKPDEIFISDGAKCDLARLQALFGSQVSIAVQDASYPVYVDGSLIHGVKNIVSMPCTPDNDFFPALGNTPRTDLIYFCSPNNPTGAVATRKQLQSLVAFAKANRSIIIFDAAYAHYIQDETLPKSIFEIPGAHEVAIEVGSFSKIAGFTGVRLGWTVVPDALTYDDGSSVKADWNRLITTLFN